jgi:hypothetical protein
MNQTKVRVQQSYTTAPLLTTSRPTISISAEECLENRQCGTPAPTTKRSVHFEERVRARKTIHLNEITDDEIDACWYSEQEFHDMRESVRIAAYLLDEGLLETDNATHCRRGAEAHAPLQSRLRRKMKLAVREAVFGEQAQQWEEGSFDPEFIAEVSALASSRSRYLARQVGLEDEVANIVML